MSLVDGRALISAAQLAQRIDEPQLRIFDCSVHLVPDPPRTYRIVSGREDWLQARLPRAGFLDLATDLSDQAATLRFTMPETHRAAVAFGLAGVVDGASIVLYASTHPMWATRVWWMLRSLGVDAMVLDGGLGAWQRGGGALESGPFHHPTGVLTARPRAGLWADRDAVLATTRRTEQDAEPQADQHSAAEGGTESGDATSVCTINALSPSMYRGDGERNYGRPGHITGSVNVPYAALFDPDTLEYRDAATLRAHFDAVDAFYRSVICYCGGGISATCDAFALTLLGHDDVRVYDGSMSEWVRDPDLPLTVGAAPA